ncbi:hypothetical protein M3Y99_00608400 [Aphelenchoides fujianensis]|nr:hypothetical protein M3Y99_00608400 [Aphelenchoides fujianensis]
MNIQANRHRQVWPTQIGGFLVSIGFVTGLANMAFFPSAICTNGQAGNFVAVYCICVVLLGFPLTYLHLCLGQYSGCNPTSAFGKLCPAFKGIGWSWLILTVPMMIISNMNTAWSLYYMYLSGRSLVMNTDLPWSYQETFRFHNREIVAPCPIISTTPPRRKWSCDRVGLVVADRGLVHDPQLGAHDEPNRLLICLPGAYEGMSLLFPDVQRISELSVWKNAIKLVFFDMQIGVGVLISISKHNRFHTNVFRDAVLMVFIDVVVNLLGACVAFGFLGFLAYNMDTHDIRAMCRGQIAPHLLEGHVFCFLYQLMLGLGAIECSFTMCEYFASALDYKIPLLRKRPCALRGLVALFMFLLTLPCCFQSGVHIYNLLVYYSMHWNLKIIALCQLGVITIVYGVDNLLANIRIMLRIPHEACSGFAGRFFGPTGYYIRYAWKWLCPLTITFALVLDLFVREEGSKSKKVGDSTLWHFLSVISIIPLPAIVIYYLYRQLQVPYDDSTISNTVLVPAEGSLGYGQGMERTIPRSSVQSTGYGGSSKLTSQSYGYSVNFVLNNSPYFPIPSTSIPLLETSRHSKEEDEEDDTRTNESEPNESSVQSESSMGGDSEDEQMNAMMPAKRHPIISPLPTEAGISRMNVDLGSLTGQPGFFSSSSHQ